GRLRYIPRPGETAENIVAFAPDGPLPFDRSGIVRIVGKVSQIPDSNDVTNNKTFSDVKKLSETLPEIEKFRKDRSLPGGDSLYVHNIRFKGIRFAYDGLTVPDTGLISPQAAIHTPATIYLDAANNVLFEECEISHTGGYAIWFHQACHGGGVRCCLMEDLGAGGIRVGSSSRANAIPLSRLSRDVVVCDNTVRRYGLIERGGHGVWVGHAAGVRIEHNEIYDGLYTGIAVGWTWGYARPRAFDNLIAFNHIHHIGMGVTSDMGGIYLLGYQPGSVVSNNVVHDVYAYEYGHGGGGLYADEGTSYAVFENNLVYRVHSSLVSQNYGYSRYWRNNIFAYSLSHHGSTPIRRGGLREEDHLIFTFENNIVLWDHGQVFERLMYDNGGKFLLRNNLYWYTGPRQTPAEKRIQFFGGRTLAQWQKAGNDSGSILADPCFVDPKHDDFRFRPEAGQTLEKIGFKPFDPSQAGLTLSARAIWKDRIDGYPLPVLKIAPPLPPAEPMTIKDNFETPRDALVLFAREGLEKNLPGPNGAPCRFQLLEENGNHFLRMNDGPWLTSAIAPYFVYENIGHTTGTTTCRFRVRFSKNATLSVNAWNSELSPSMKQNITFAIDHGRVLAAGKEWGRLEPDRWYYVSFSMSRNGANHALWQLCIAPSENGKPGTPLIDQKELGPIPLEATALQRMAICCRGRNESTVDLDDFILENK
ncbi:MAG: right-handed parallel beta-helix repeat-containing protein, partial [Planctomycetia bacterium]|nr:right-handed parallel beta-helix repeat-containing protein [Planctomycetia bacterium]